MKRCTATLRTTRSCQARRWVSHDKSTLTPDVLQRQVEAGLGHDADGNPLRVAAESGTVSTAAGDLPISPVFDPAWIKSRRRQRKDDPVKPLGRFRRKLTLNPYARALASPIRQCAFTDARIPRYLLQDIELVSHPTTGEPWYAPGPLAFEKVKPIYRPSELPTESKDSHSASKTLEGAESETSEQKMEGEPVEGTTRGHDRPRRAPLTVYTINRKDMLDPLGPGAKQLGALFGPRQGTAWSPEFRKAVWRKDMSDVILDMMRRTVVDALITRTTRESGAQDKFVEPVSNWETVRDVKRRQSVLWLPREAEDGSDSAHAASEYATLDVGGVQYYRKMAVHNLVWMLGSEEVARLRENVPAIFGQHEILVLKYWGSHSMVNLHMLLWRLHGYLARTPALPDGPEVEPGPGKRESPAQKTKQPKGPLDQRPVKKMARTLAELMPKS